MKQIIIFGIIIVSILLALYINNLLQKKMRPRASAKRLLLYILTCLVMVTVITFCMVFVIIKLFPGELIK